MKTVRYLLIGGGLASQRAASHIRTLDATGTILMVGQEPHLPYDRPPLTKDFLQGKMPREKVFLEPSSFYQEKAVEVLTGTAVEALDASAKTARLAGGETVAFEKALIATGGRPVRLDIPGAQLDGVRYYRTLDDAESLSARAGGGLRVAIIGGGFIGMELAGSLTQRGAAVTVLHRGPHIWDRFAGAELAAFFQDHCTRRGVTILTGQRVARIEGETSARAVVTESGLKVDCDLVCVAVGIVPNVELARQGGLRVDNGILANEFCQTSHADIYAAGDVMNFLDAGTGQRRRVEHWGLADYSGGLAGENMAGAGKTFDFLPYVWSDIFDLHLEFAGDERGCDRTILRGRMEDNSFAVLYLRGGQVTAFFAVNMKRKVFKPIQRLIETRADVAGQDDRLRDMAFDLGQLLAPAV